jgi:RNA polymerase sigma-70 factor (ECF subfamily)
MYRIATNEAITFINQKAKRNGTTSEAMQNKIVDNLQADTYFDGNEIQLKLQKAILLLPEKQQLVFKMKYYEEIKYEDMSEILGTSVGALKASYHHAVKKIEEFMKTN